MRYWGYLALKLSAATGVLYATGRMLFSLLPPPAPVRHVVLKPFGTDLQFTVLVMVWVDWASILSAP